MPGKKKITSSDRFFPDLSAKEQKLVQSRFEALAEINRQRALAVESHFELIRSGIASVTGSVASW